MPSQRGNRRPLFFRKSDYGHATVTVGFCAFAEDPDGICASILEYHFCSASTGVGSTSIQANAEFLNSDVRLRE